MSTSQGLLEEQQHTTPPPSDKKVFAQASRVIRLFKTIEAGKHIGLPPWTEFQLAPGEFDEIERQIEQDEVLAGFAKAKLRYDYDARSRRLISGSDQAAQFASEVHPARSTDIYFPVDDREPGAQSKFEPDASFEHDDAKYPGVIIEVSYANKRKRLKHLAEDYLLDSNANVQVVIGFDIEYGKKESRKVTFSVWRTEITHTAEGSELGVVQEIKDIAFRDDDGKPTDHPGLRLTLSDFATKSIAAEELGDDDPELVISTDQLSKYLTMAEHKTQRLPLLKEDSIAPGIKKRKRAKLLQNE